MWELRLHVICRAVMVFEFSEVADLYSDSAMDDASSGLYSDDEEYGEEESSGLGEETPTLVPRGGTWTITIHYLVLPSTYYAMKTQQTHRMSSPCK